MTPVRLLIVDDEDTVRSLVRSALAANGFDLREARDGQEALERAAELAPDLVVLDWQMPGLSGPEVLTELKRRHPRTRVVLLTAALSEREGGLASILGADAFLAKPFRVDDLLEAVRAALR